ncbi:MAG: hypothetical protein AAGE89_09785 [Pseudomonadota bacterium]
MANFGRMSSDKPRREPYERPVPQKEPPQKKPPKEASLFSVCLYTSLGLSGFAMLGIHRFYAKGIINGLLYLAIFIGIGAIGITLGVHGVEPLGRTIWNVMILVGVIACIECCIWGFWDSVRMIRKGH